jgi:1,4-alpha-glucan branching enzyme
MVLNFTPVPREGYRIGVPRAGGYLELLNSDAAVYGGGNIGNGGLLESDPVEAHGFPDSLYLTLPPLGCLLIRPG